MTGSTATSQSVAMPEKSLLINMDFSVAYQIDFLQWELLYVDSKSTEICSLGCNWQDVSVGSDNGWAPNKGQAIIWSNDDPFY